MITLDPPRKAAIHGVLAAGLIAWNPGIAADAPPPSFTSVRITIVVGGESKVSAGDCHGIIVGPGVNQPEA